MRPWETQKQKKAHDHYNGSVCEKHQAIDKKALERRRKISRKGGIRLFFTIVLIFLKEAAS